MSSLLLVDGSSYLYRAFHAMPDLRNAAGEPTGAVYGVLNMLRRLLAEQKAEYRAVVFDAKGKTFRDDWYPEYKAHRPPMPDDLAAQIEPLHAAIRAAGWPLLMVDGVEADDVIGTLARQAAAQGMTCVISTGDKDMAQLVDDKVTLVNTMSNEILDTPGVEAKFGVPPNRIIDYLTLVGDAVDGVPGVEKVGPKTAVKWLTQHGTLDGVIANADSIGGAVGANLKKALDFLPLGRKLVTIVCDLELAQQVTDLTPTPVDQATLVELFTRLEFKTWLKEAQQGKYGEARADAGSKGKPDTTPLFAPSPAVPEEEPDRSAYVCITSWAQFDEWLAIINAAKLTALDTETTDLDQMQAKLVGISFACEAGKAAYIPL
ncbi:MAG: DNA polymerase I, partial [Rhodocyclaceae bacterium]|nr:DNA polymerase I [Rhodocyclaceae bacterium]